MQCSKNFIDPRFPNSILYYTGSCGHTVLRAHEHRPTHVDKHSLEQGPFLFAIGTRRHPLIQRPRRLTLTVRRPHSQVCAHPHRTLQGRLRHFRPVSPVRASRKPCPADALEDVCSRTLASERILSGSCHGRQTPLSRRPLLLRARASALGSRPKSDANLLRFPREHRGV